MVSGSSGFVKFGKFIQRKQGFTFGYLHILKHGFHNISSLLKYCKKLTLS